VAEWGFFLVGGGSVTKASPSTLERSPSLGDSAGTTAHCAESGQVYRYGQSLPKLCKIISCVWKLITLLHIDINYNQRFN
jgi:hypothetical protein